MLDSTIELISLAASNSLAVFCFCNLIIAILLVGNSKQSPQFDGNLKKYTVSSSEQGNGLMKIEEEKVSSLSIDMVGHKEEIPDEEEEEEDDNDDDELRQRVEEFIEKINRGWRAEKLKTYSLGQ